MLLGFANANRNFSCAHVPEISILLARTQTEVCAPACARAHARVAALACATACPREIMVLDREVSDRNDDRASVGAAFGFGADCGLAFFRILFGSKGGVRG